MHPKVADSILGSTLEMPWLALGGPLLSFYARTAQCDFSTTLSALHFETCITVCSSQLQVQARVVSSRVRLFEPACLKHGTCF